MAEVEDFRKVVQLKTNQEKDATYEECVLRFFAFLYDRESFEHLVDDYLTTYMDNAGKHFDYKKAEIEFRSTFAELAKVFPEGLKRHGKKNK